MDNAWHNAWRAVLAVSACILLATACGESTPLVQKDSLEMRELARNFATPPESVQKLDPTPFLTCIARPPLYKILWHDLARILPSAAI